jgi:hypothetical protein
MNDRDSRRSGGYLPGPGDGRTSVDLWGPYDGQSLDRQSAEIVACETSYVRARCAELGPVRSSASLMPPGTGREPMNLRVVAEAACTLWVPYWAPGWATDEFSRRHPSATEILWLAGAASWAADDPQSVLR